MKLQSGDYKLTHADGAISGEIFQGWAGPVAGAVGFDVRREEYLLRNDAPALAVADAPFPTDIFVDKRTRNVKAVYAEVAVPLYKDFELSAAVRRDDYSDFGGTTNPKVSIKYAPTKELLFRSSYSEGFRAPSFTQLYSPTSEAQIPGNIADPILCPQNPGNPTFCAIRPNGRSGGNPDLQPETSKQWSFGMVVAPLSWLSGNIDFYEIKRNDRIYVLTPQVVVANYQTFPESLVRGPNGRLDEAGGYIRAGLVNADGDTLRGVDVGVQARGNWGPGKWSLGIDGTYTSSFKTRIFNTQPFVELVGKWDVQDLFVRWRHTATFTYSQGPWSASLMQRYTAGYKDEVPAGVANAPDFVEEVKEYIVYDMSATYTGFKNLTLTGGIKNIGNTDPPFTAHNVDFAGGTAWDPRVADPRGRAFTLRATYKFK